jgi:hypothetical protein
MFKESLWFFVTFKISPPKKIMMLLTHSLQYLMNVFEYSISLDLFQIISQVVTQYIRNIAMSVF